MNAKFYLPSTELLLIWIKTFIELIELNEPSKLFLLLLIRSARHQPRIEHLYHILTYKLYEGILAFFIIFITCSLTFFK